MKKTTLLNKIDNQKGRSAWRRGVLLYAYEIVEAVDWLEDFDFSNFKQMKSELLNGAEDWERYSWGGNSLCYDEEIAERLCTKSDLKRFNGGKKTCNGKDWLDIQAFALKQACSIIWGLLIEGADLCA